MYRIEISVYVNSHISAVNNGNLQSVVANFVQNLFQQILDFLPLENLPDINIP